MDKKVPLDFFSVVFIPASVVDSYDFDDASHEEHYFIIRVVLVCQSLDFIH